MRVTKEKQDPLVCLDPKGNEALKVGELVRLPENPDSAPGSADLVFLAPKGIKEIEAWRVVQVIRAQRAATESVQRPVSLAMVLRVNLVFLAPQDQEVCLVSWDPKDPSAPRAIWVIWDPLDFVEWWVTKETKGLWGNVTAPMGLTGPMDRKGREVKRGNKAQQGAQVRGVLRDRKETWGWRGGWAHLVHACPTSSRPLLQG